MTQRRFPLIPALPYVPRAEGDKKGPTSEENEQPHAGSVLGREEASPLVSAQAADHESDQAGRHPPRDPYGQRYTRQVVDHLFRKFVDTDDRVLHQACDGRVHFTTFSFGSLVGRRRGLQTLLKIRIPPMKTAMIRASATKNPKFMSLSCC